MRCDDAYLAALRRLILRAAHRGFTEAVLGRAFRVSAQDTHKFLHDTEDRAWFLVMIDQEPRVLSAPKKQQKEEKRDDNARLVA